ncbi:hypothetical protein GIV23_05425 [Pseudomonas sp. PA-1-2A]|uniref:GTPase-associated system all-helical protein GASH n=1 Tax=Pseudomonas TaxID=286 RepID=UPI001EF11A05|nr:MULTISPECIES: GTPase-associated system all-helical protein GASH [Pseudomonas]MCF5691283.1 hypothetical protein [Pseudomonas sp. PA-1-8C]MCF5786275.1 hypothetical protein [Pseudomonas sp. PA-1-6G]MCF5791991.1 hypothetical protein [Pseudomonas sp. PA-1-6B]MCF5796184.1 hypothetical protein [Pseudomonas sp. PA-1-5A]MCF5812750.1 hypothetical protein [Pseudomonas sp. PA-1-2A]
MAKFTFADRYAQASLAPSPQVISSRQEPANRIVSTVVGTGILDLVGAYYGSPDVDLGWFRDEFAKEDASFSLVNNERETKLLAALILEQLVGKARSEAILAIIAGSVMGLRQPAECEWLLRDAKEALGRLSVTNREPQAVETNLTPTYTAKLKEEIAGIVEGDWAALLVALGKMRAETQSSANTVATQSSKALKVLDREIDLLREESQMLWWLFSGHSRSVERSFSLLTPHQAAVIGAFDLGNLTTVSLLGPVAAPAILERIIGLSKKSKGTQAIELSKVIDGFSPEDLESLEVASAKLPPRLAPFTTALDLAKTMGNGAWHVRFSSKTGLDASIVSEPLALANQLYREHLLGQLL